MTKITNITLLAQTRLFRIEQVDLEFTNGQTRTFERLKSSGRKSVMVVPMIDACTVVLIKEYAAGTEQYELGLPRGLVEFGEDVLVAANRELREEIGFASGKIQFLSQLTVSPNYMSHVSELVLAQELTPNKLTGDEPEPLEVIYYDINKIHHLILNKQITDARSIAGIFIAKAFLENGNNL